MATRRAHPDYGPVTDAEHRMVRRLMQESYVRLIDADHAVGDKLVACGVASPVGIDNEIALTPACHIAFLAGVRLGGEVAITEVEDLIRRGLFIPNGP